MAIAIIDYGMANLRSVQNAFAQVGVAAEIIDTPAQLSGRSHVVLPGVGAFKDAIATLRRGGWIEPLKQHISADKPLLGICLGMQLLFDRGFEDGEHEGMGVVAGACIRFEVDRTLGLKVPHMGWNQLTLPRPCPLYEGIAPGSGVYFVHSYHVVPADVSVIASTTDYGGAFVSSIHRGNLFATQFHPEKSQSVGLKILRNFAAVR
jgi:glutamine amidotransferase